MIKYSVVIPTRNGAKYLPYAINSVLESPRDDIELIVSNNFSKDDTSELLSKISDSRLKVISPPLSLPMAGHYEFAISYATGEWITILGDDDAVMPYIFESLDDYIEQYPNIDIISSVRAYYFWENCEDLYGDSVVSYSSHKKSQVRSTKRDLFAALAGLRSCFDMPQIYTTSVVKKSLYKEIKARSGGSFYHSIIPDMYSVTALCLSREKYLRVEEPLFWVGTSAKSMGRSDRIYQDAKAFFDNQGEQYSWIPMAISRQVSYLLHSSGFGALYLYEGVLQNPVENNFQSSKLVQCIVLSAIFRDLKRREKNLRVELLQEIWTECNKNSISKHKVIILSRLLNIISTFQRLIRLKNKIIRRLSIFTSDYVRLISSDRQKFKTVSDASTEVVHLRSITFKKR